MCRLLQNKRYHDKKSVFDFECKKIAGPNIKNNNFYRNRFAIGLSPN